MAKIIEFPGFAPVNEGEQRVLDAFAATLGPEVRIYPNVLMRVKQSRFAEFDQIVLTDDRIWVIEVKDYYGHAIFYRGNHLVDGERHSDPISGTRLKAQQLKDRLTKEGEDGGVFVDHRIVLAKQPQALDVEPEYDGYVLSIEEALSVIQDPQAHGVPRRHIPVQRFDGIEAALALRPRPVDLRPTFGNIRAEHLLADGPTARIWSAREKELQRPWLLEELVRPEGMSDVQWAAQEQAAVNRVRMLQFLNGAPGLLVPQTAVRSLSGAVAVVHPVPEHPTFEEVADDVHGWEDGLRRRILARVTRAIISCRNRAMAHRRIGPSAVRVDPATGRAWLTDFSKVLREGDADIITAAEWQVLAEDIWAAPEHFAGGPVGRESDLYGLGGLAQALWPDGVPADLDAAVAGLTAADPAIREGGLTALMAALAPKPSDQPVEPAPGVSWAGYRLEKQLGVAREPGVGVWRASNELTGKVVVVRIYEEDADQGGAAILAKALQGIAHENLAQVLSAGLHRDRAYVASEFVSGPNVRAVLEETGPLGAGAAVRAAVQILDALSVVHAGAGNDRPPLVHRRVSPDNIIVDPARGAVLVNFGPPPTIDSQVAVNEPEYRPLDEAVRPDDPDADLFAVGALLHEMTVGTHPFEGGDPLGGRLRIDPAVGSGLSAVLARALASDRAQRYATAGEFLADLIALGLPDVELPQVAADVLDLREQLDTAVRERRWDDAESLCPSAWTRVLERIRAQRARWEAADAQAPLLEVEGFRLRFVREERDVTAALPGTGDVLGDDRIYLADREDGTALTIAVFLSAQGEGIVRVTEVMHGDAGLKRLQQGLRIGIRPADPVADLTMDLRQARYVADPQPGKHPISQYLVSAAELDAGAGRDVGATLSLLGATGYGTRAEVLEETGKKRSELCVAFPRSATDLPAAAYVLTRIAPVVRGVRHG